MSSGTNAFGPRAGFNQSGGAYYMVLTALANSDGTTTTNNFVNTITTAASGSGGATSNATFAPTLMSAVIGTGTTAANAAGFVQAGKLLKDMGKTVVSSGRTFRKFAPVVAGLGVSSFGVVGAAGTATNTGYGSFYLEVGREGFAASTTTGLPAPIVRYF
jgi:hypothetical protein